MYCSSYEGGLCVSDAIVPKDFVSVFIQKQNFHTEKRAEKDSNTAHESRGMLWQVAFCRKPRSRSFSKYVFYLLWDPLRRNVVGGTIMLWRGSSSVVIFFLSSSYNLKWNVINDAVKS